MATKQWRRIARPEVLLAVVVLMVSLAAPHLAFGADSGATATVTSPAAARTGETSTDPTASTASAGANDTAGVTARTTGSTGGPGVALVRNTGNRYAVNLVKLAGGRLVVARWNPCQSAITYQVNLAGVAGARRDRTLATIRAAFATLAAADGMTYRYGGTTSFVPTVENLTRAPAEIVVAAVPRTRTDLPLTADSLGYGGVLWSTWSGPAGAGAAVVRGYVVLDTTSFSSLRPGFGRGRTQGNVILHELGHATGLDHVDSVAEQMDPTLTDASPNGYAAGDRAGLRSLGDGAGCITIPTGAALADLN